MPGRLLAVNVSPGERVTKGQRLACVEAMKMELALVAPFGGIVEAVSAEAGSQVREGDVLIRLVQER